MSKYLVSIDRYFSGEETHEIEAENKSQAKEMARRYFSIIGAGNYKLDSVEVIKKLNTK